MLVMVSLSAEQWRSIAAEKVLSLLGEEGAVTKPEMEAKLSEAPPQPGLRRPEPHHLTMARNRLLEAGEIVSQRNTTRGGRVVSTFSLAATTKQADRVAARKRLLHSRYLSWSASPSEWGVPPLPSALERVIHASLTESAVHGYRLVKPGGGEVGQLLGQPVAGGPLDNAAFYTALSTDGMPRAATTVLVEAKNLRQWIYPRTQELYQVLDKSARLQVAHPEQSIVPVLVCRKQHFTTGVMAKQMGFHVIGTWRQYVRPIVAGSPEDERKFTEVNDELRYNLALHEGSVEQMVNQFVSVLPGRMDDVVARWRAVALHPDVPEILARLRDDGINNDERRDALVDLREAVNEVTGEDRAWGPNPDEV